MSRQIPGLYILQDEQRGRSVHTSLPISKGDIIEIAPVLVIPKNEVPLIHKTVLHDYYFLWGEDEKSCAISLGFGSLYNHATFPNATYNQLMDEDNIEFVAIQDIEPGDEITINYHGESGCDEKLWFKIE